MVKTDGDSHYFEYDYSKENNNLSSRDEDMVEAYIKQVARNMQKASIQIISPSGSKKYKNILRWAATLAMEYHGRLVSCIDIAKGTCEVRVTADVLEYDEHSPELKMIIEKSSGVSFSIDKKGTHLVMLIDVPLFQKI